MNNEYATLNQVSWSLVALMMLNSSAVAQTTGTLDTQIGQPWSTAPWTITTGPGTYPDAGGVATFREQINTVPGVSPNLTNITLDVPVTLSGLNFGSGFRWQIGAGAGGPLTLSSTGATINAEFPERGQRYQITAPIAGGGSAGLIKTGDGNITLSGIKSYTGGTHVNGGTLEITTGDGTLGATGVGNGLSFNGGALRVSGGILTTSRSMNIGAGGGSLELLANGTLNGVIGGPGDLFVTGPAGTAAFTADNTLTGTLGFVSRSMVFRLSGANGAFRFADAYHLSAGFTLLDSSTANNNDRLRDAAQITSDGGLLVLLGNNSTATTESAGVLDLHTRNTLINVMTGIGQPASLSFQAINRQNAATLFLQGTSLGAPPGPNVAQISSATSPGALIGGGGATGSRNISILPWASGNTSGIGGSSASTHITYNAVTGRFRPLASNEYSPAFGGDPTNNVRLTANTSAPAGTTVNTLLFAPPDAATLSGGPINITSGSFLYSPTASFVLTPSVVSAGLNFGTAEGVINATNPLEISGVIAGSGGLTITSPTGSMLTLSGANTYTGPTTILAGTVRIRADVGSDPMLNATSINHQIQGAPANGGPFGTDTSPIVMHPGSVFLAEEFVYIYRGVVVFDDPNTIEIETDPNAVVIASLPDVQVIINGGIETRSAVDFAGGTTPESAVEVNGSISGPGSIGVAQNSYLALKGNNTYSGDTIIKGHVLAGHNSAFGSGLIIFSADGGSMEAIGPAPRTFANDVEMEATAAFPGNVPLRFTGNVKLNGLRTFIIPHVLERTTFSGNLTSGSVVKEGSGTMVLDRAAGNDYSGGTTVSFGTFVVNNTSGSGTGSGTVYVGEEGTLSGAFDLAVFAVDPVTVDGNLKPGNSAGTATFRSGLLLGAVAETTMELASASLADDINVTGELTLDGTVVVMTINGYVAQAGDSFDLFDWGSLNASNFDPGSDLDLTGAAIAPGASWDKSNFLVDGTIHAVPEPFSWSLLVAGSAILMISRSTGRARRRCLLGVERARLDWQ